MKLVKKAEFARMCGVTAQAINNACKRGVLPIVGEGKKSQIDLHDAIVLAYLQAENIKRNAKGGEDGTKNNNIQNPVNGTNGINQNTNNTNNNKPVANNGVPNGQTINVDRAAGLAEIEVEDINEGTAKTAIEKLKLVEQIRQIQVRTDRERKELIPRETVKKVFGKLFQIDVQEWRTLGDKIAPKLASVFGVDDPEKIIAATEQINDETFKVLQHVKREINDFLKKAEAGEIE